MSHPNHDELQVYNFHLKRNRCCQSITITADESKHSLTVKNVPIHAAGANEKDGEMLYRLCDALLYLGFNPPKPSEPKKTITAQDVKAVREASGCGMLKAKNCLKECNGDIEAAIVVARIP